MHGPEANVVISPQRVIDSPGSLCDQHQAQMSGKYLASCFCFLFKIMASPSCTCF